MFAVWAPLVVPFVAAPLITRLATRLTLRQPRRAALLVSASSTLLAACSLAVLALLTVAGALHTSPVADIAHLRQGARGNGTWSIAVACVAGTLFLAASAAAGRRLHVLAAGVRRARHDCAAHACGGDLTVLPDAGVDAYALPGGFRARGRVVVTAGMLRALEPAEREVLLAHERAHLTHRHHVFLAIGEVAAHIHPALRSLRGPLVYALERWADESAAHAVGDRRLTARAVGRAALAASRREAVQPVRPRFAMTATAGPVPLRMAALMAPPARVRSGAVTRVALALAAGVVALSGLCTIEAAGDLHARIEIAQGEMPMHAH